MNLRNKWKTVGILAVIIFIDVAIMSIYIIRGAEIGQKAEEDTYIDSGNPSTSYGNNDYIHIGIDSSGNMLEAYFMFDLRYNPKDWERVELALYFLEVKEPQQFTLILINDNSWREDTLTWNTRLSHSEILDNFTISEESFYRFDITNYMTGKDWISFCVNATKTIPQQVIKMYSHEGYRAEFQAPRLAWIYPNLTFLYIVGGIVAIIVQASIGLVYYIYKKRKHKGKTKGDH